MIHIPATRRGFLSRLSQVTSAAGLLRFSHGTSGQSGALASGRDVYDVTAFGARGDSKTFDTAAINQAITAAAAAGGATVIFPAGTYLSYSIRLKSNVGLHLGHGCVLVAAEGNGYDAAESNQPWENYQDYGHNHWHNSLIWGEQLHDVSISGPGLIWGKGLSRGEGAFRSNQVRLALSLLAYNLGNLWRRLGLPRGIEHWSLTSLQQRLVKTGGRLVKHARYYWLLLAGEHLTRRRFGAMMGRIALLPVPTG